MIRTWYRHSQITNSIADVFSNNDFGHAFDSLALHHFIHSVFDGLDVIQPVVMITPPEQKPPTSTPVLKIQINNHRPEEFKEKTLEFHLHFGVDCPAACLRFYQEGNPMSHH